MTHRGTALVALIGLAVYGFFCPPVSGMGDASEFTLVLATHGVAHPTGYPIYTLFGHLFCTFLHALGVSWPHAANLLSAVGGAIALYLLHALGMELAKAVPETDATTRFLAALIPLSLFAFQPIMLGEATHAEVNVWSLAWTCGAAYTFVRLAGAIRDCGVEPDRRAHRGAALWGLVCGVGFAHHLSSVLIAAPLSAALITLLARRRRLSPSLLFAAVAAGLLPVASYGIIAWRASHPARVQWASLDPGLAGAVRHIIGSQYRFFVGYFAPNPFQKELIVGTVFPFLLPGLALLLLGVVRARNAEWRIACSALFAAALLVTIFSLRYGVSDPAPYFLPAMALGTAAAAPAITAIRGVGTRAGAMVLASAGLAGLFLIVPWLRDGIEERVATIQYEKVIHSMWSAIPPDTAIVSWSDDRFHRLREYQILRGEKPALLIIAPDLLFTNSIRREIQRRFGADPLEGFHRPYVAPGAPNEREVIDEHRQRLVMNLNARIRVPVILFDPSVPIVWQLDKPWDPQDGRSTAPRPLSGHARRPPLGLRR